MQELSTDNLDHQTLLALLRGADSAGVLSIYVDARPNGGRRHASTAAIDIRNRLAELERRLESGADPERARLLQATLAAHEGELERLVDPREPGRGRALYLPLGGGEPALFANRLPLPNRVVLDDSAFVHPLLELIDEARPAGVVLVSAREAELFEWRYGELHPLGRVRAGEIEAPHERSGPVGSSPRSTPVREQRAARRRNQRQSLVSDTAAAVADLAGERGWTRLLVSGGDRLTDALTGALPVELRDGVVEHRRGLARLPHPELEAEVTRLLLEDNREQEQRLLHSLRERAFGRGLAALGLSEVLAALNQGRVAHLAYDPDVRFSGSVDDGGALHADGEAPAVPARVHQEPRMTERIVERSLATGARVSPVEGASAGALSEAGGIAALLRW
jgi:hypothetical protein